MSDATPSETTPPIDAVDAMKQIDEVLAVEDPGFVARIEKIKEEPVAIDPAQEIEASDISELLEDGALAMGSAPATRPTTLTGSFKYVLSPDGMIGALKGRISDRVGRIKDWFRYMAKKGIKNALKSGLGYLKASLLFLRGLVVHFWHFPRLTKFALIAVIALGFALVKIVKLTLHDQFLPSMETEFLTSFAKVADEAFEYSPDEPLEEFNSPLRNPEFMIETEKVVVNLRRSEEHPNPMGFFEFYVEGTTQEAAMEMNDRSHEATDVVQRSIEEMTYDELVTPAGKNKLKTLIRKQLNSMLTKGRVRKIFIKSIVLKP